ncbi:E3 ubiquitin-protein ligase RHF2A [Camellia lanceoleosa]|uniref:E3 ubiquitin-protein ligase RHF2A n=1 Tax=Camellia lanceoleosa TaxID=1840588 RepID=A0ACC0HID4_9ERIC|nr:E3 ubiquitin-protein ligase RHF2A [Camellia lanceoleosa]
MQLAVGANDAELEERIIQHLAAAAMGRAHHHIARRDGPRSQSSVHGPPQFVSVPLAGGDEPQQLRHQFHSVQTDQFSSSSSGSTMMPGNRQGISVHNRGLVHKR